MLEGDGSPDAFAANIESYNNYYAFGMEMPGRSYNSPKYRYGFNGKEKDREGLGGGGSTYDYGFRIYNPQIGKFLSVDPLTDKYPWYTPYQYAGNIPIAFSDLDGLEPKQEIRKKDGTIETIVPASDNLPVTIDPRMQFKPLNLEQDEEMVSTTLDFIPLVGTLKGWYESYAGKDAITDKELSELERSLNVIPFSKVAKGGSKLAAKSADELIEASEKVLAALRKYGKQVHGNSKLSEKVTYLYRLVEEKTGKYLKTGVTSEKIPVDRYSRKEMEGKSMEILDSGTRKDMLKKEKEIVETNPGPMNKESYAGKKKKE